MWGSKTRRWVWVGWRYGSGPEWVGMVEWERVSMRVRERSERKRKVQRRMRVGFGFGSLRLKKVEENDDDGGGGGGELGFCIFLVLLCLMCKNGCFFLFF